MFKAKTRVIYLISSLLSFNVFGNDSISKLRGLYQQGDFTLQVATDSPSPGEPGGDGNDPRSGGRNQNNSSSHQRALYHFSSEFAEARQNLNLLKEVSDEIERLEKLTIENQGESAFLRTKPLPRNELNKLINLMSKLKGVSSLTEIIEVNNLIEKYDTYIGNKINSSFKMTHKGHTADTYYSNGNGNGDGFSKVVRAASSIQTLVRIESLMLSSSPLIVQVSNKTQIDILRKNNGTTIFRVDGIEHTTLPVEFFTKPTTTSFLKGIITKYFPGAKTISAFALLSYMVTNSQRSEANPADPSDSASEQRRNGHQKQTRIPPATQEESEFSEPGSQ